jgi:hypothetical protein
MDEIEGTVELGGKEWKLQADFGALEEIEERLGLEFRPNYFMEDLMETRIRVLKTSRIALVAMTRAAGNAISDDELSRMPASDIVKKGWPAVFRLLVAAFQDLGAGSDELEQLAQKLSGEEEEVEQVNAPS